MANSPTWSFRGQDSRCVCVREREREGEGGRERGRREERFGA